MTTSGRARHGARGAAPGGSPIPHTPHPSHERPTFRLRVVRGATVAGAWTEAGAVVSIASAAYAAALLKRRVAEPADAATADQLAPVVRNASTRALKRAVWRELKNRGASLVVQEKGS